MYKASQKRKCVVLLFSCSFPFSNIVCELAQESFADTMWTLEKYRCSHFTQYLKEDDGVICTSMSTDLYIACLSLMYLKIKSKNVEYPYQESVCDQKKSYTPKMKNKNQCIIILAKSSKFNLFPKRNPFFPKFISYLSKV